jgi:acetyl-CoA synthetase
MEKQGNDVDGVLCIKQPWPSLARTIYGDHQRFISTYLAPYKGYYFTGDGCYRDKDGYIWITGRVDDVLNMSGHRLGTAEVESALASHKSCAEAAVVGVPHDIKGEAIFCYVVLAEGVQAGGEAAATLKNQVRAVIGAWATPDHICIVPNLPKTRSGKIMRRILRKIAGGERNISTLGDLSTLADPNVIEQLIQAVENMK